MDALPFGFADALSDRGTARRLDRGELLIVAGDTDTDAFLVTDGRFRVSLLSRTGREPLLAEVGAGSLIGELAAIDSQSRSATVTAVTPASVVRIDAATFRELLLSRSEWTLWLLRALSARSRSMTGRHLEFATLSVNGRVLAEVARLTAFGERYGDHAVLEDFPTHEDLAARIGTQREAVTRALRALARSGVIKQQRRRLEVLSVDTLHARLEAEGGEVPDG